MVNQMDCLSLKTPRMIGALSNLLGYSLVLIGIFRKRLFKEPQYLFLANLAANNIAISILINLSIVQTDLTAVTEVVDFFTHFFLRSFFVWTNVLSLNRYVAITRCLRYPLIMTIFRIRAVVILSWVVSGILCAIAYIEDHFETETDCLVSQRYLQKVSLALLIMITVIVSVSTSYAVHVSAKRQRRKIMSQIRSLYGEQSERMDSLRKQEMKTRGIFIVICTSYAFFIPTICFWFLRYFENLPATWLALGGILTAVYACICPYIYIATSKPLKSSLLSMIASIGRYFRVSGQHLKENNCIAIVN